MVSSPTTGKVIAPEAAQDAWTAMQAWFKKYKVLD